MYEPYRNKLSVNYNVCIYYNTFHSFLKTLINIYYMYWEMFHFDLPVLESLLVHMYALCTRFPVLYTCMQFKLLQLEY